MAYELKEGQGSLFKNERREKDTHPNLQGTILVAGVEYWINGWTKEGAKGRWISLSVKPKEAAAKPAGKAPKPAADDFDDDQNIPF